VRAAGRGGGVCDANVFRYHWWTFGDVFRRALLLLAALRCDPDAWSDEDDDNDEKNDDGDRDDTNEMSAQQVADVTAFINEISPSTTLKTATSVAFIPTPIATDVKTNTTTTKPLSNVTPALGASDWTRKHHLSALRERMVNRLVSARQSQ
jgi:hypothetical protein